MAKEIKIEKCSSIISSIIKCSSIKSVHKDASKIIKI